MYWSWVWVSVNVIRQEQLFNNAKSDSVVVFTQKLLFQFLLKNQKQKSTTSAVPVTKTLYALFMRINLLCAFMGVYN